MKIILVILLVSFRTGSSLKCIKCSGSDDASCELNQAIEDCPNQFQNPACVTLTYSEKLNKEGKMVHTMEKKCVERSGCKHCSRFWLNCKTLCCKQDLCNSRMTKMPEVNQKAKRGITDESSSATICIANVTLFIVVTMVTMFFL